MTTTLTNELTQQSTKRIGWKLVGYTALAMLAAGAANVGLYLAAGQLYPDITAWTGAGIGQILGANNAYLTLGAIVYAIIHRRSANPARTFLRAATIGLILSFGMPVAAGLGYAAGGAPAASAATVITLSLMHVMSYLITVSLFTRIAK